MTFSLCCGFVAQLVSCRSLVRIPLKHEKFLFQALVSRLLKLCTLLRPLFIIFKPLCTNLVSIIVVHFDGPLKCDIVHLNVASIFTTHLVKALHRYREGQLFEYQ